MRIVSGTCRTTPLEWLPVLSHIAPPSIQRQNSQLREFLKITSNRPLPINKIIDNPPTKRLKSRKPFWIDGQALHQVNFTTNDAWRDSWSRTNVRNHHLVQDPSVCPPGFQLPRRSWTLLNRLRCGQGRCAYLMHKWKFGQDPKCTCGSPQTMDHIVDVCPVYAFPGGLINLHNAGDDAEKWLSTFPLDL